MAYGVSFKHFKALQYEKEKNVFLTCPPNIIVILHLYEVIIYLCKDWSFLSEYHSFFLRPQNMM